MPLRFRNFTAAIRKPALKLFNLMMQDQDLSYIESPYPENAGVPTKLTMSPTPDGTNGSDGTAVFLIVGATSDVLSADVRRNGKVCIQGTEYTRAGITCTFISPWRPVAGDILEAMVWE